MEPLYWQRQITLEDLAKFQKDFKVLEEMIYLQNQTFNKMLKENNVVFMTMIKSFIMLNNAKLQCLSMAKNFIDKTFDEFIKTSEPKDFQ